MGLTYADVVALVQMDPYWHGFDDRIFERRVYP